MEKQCCLVVGSQNHDQSLQGFCNPIVNKDGWLAERSGREYTSRFSDDKSIIILMLYCVLCSIILVVIQRLP